MSQNIRPLIVSGYQSCEKTSDNSVSCKTNDMRIPGYQGDKIINTKGPAQVCEIDKPSDTVRCLQNKIWVNQVKNNTESYADFYNRLEKSQINSGYTQCRFNNIDSNPEKSQFFDTEITCTDANNINVTFNSGNAYKKYKIDQVTQTCYKENKKDGTPFYKPASVYCLNNGAWSPHMTGDRETKMSATDFIAFTKPNQY